MSVQTRYTTPVHDRRFTTGDGLTSYAAGSLLARGGQVGQPFGRDDAL